MIHSTKQFLLRRKKSISYWMRQLGSRSPHRQVAVAWLDYLRTTRGVNFPLMGLSHHDPLELPTDRGGDMPASISMVGLPVISIVTPSYNQAHMLERTIRSVLDQNYPRLQFVVQDGGSKDHSVEIIKRYASRLHHWESCSDEGQAHAIQMGFARTTGDVMGWLNSDDILMPGALWDIARFFQKNKNVDVAYGHRVIIDEDDRKIGQWVLPANTHKYLPYADYLAQESVYWTRRIWDKVGGVDRSFQFAMDWDLFLRFWRASGRFQRIPKSIGAFRIHSAQKTSSIINDVGAREMDRLRRRELGHVPHPQELARQLIWLYWRNYAMDSANKMGLYRVA